MPVQTQAQAAAPAGGKAAISRTGSRRSVDTAAKMDQAASTGGDAAAAAAAAGAKSSGSAGGAPLVDDAGVVNNAQSLTEEEAEQMLAPEEYYTEEERLREEREKAAADEANAAPSGEEACLTQARFNQLDQLLNRAGMYTQFLTEQMAAYRADTLAAAGSGAEAAAVAAAEAAAAAAEGEEAAAAAAAAEEEEEEGAAAAGGKRKKGGKAAATAASKKAKAASLASVAAKGAAAAAAAAGAAASGGTLAERQKALLPLIEGELREYQLAGVTWLISLYQNGLNGILADQMGLGKTVQTVSFLSHLRAKGVYGPFLVIGPLSTLRNWASEVRRWCPSMPVLEYHGRGAKARAELRRDHMPLGPAGAAFPVICSTYEIVMADIKPLARYGWKYIVVDEGHRLKNFNCKLIRDLRTLPADNKLLLTGTPLQNNLGELWSLLNFLLPDIFGSLADFQAWFDFSSAVGSEAADREILAAEQRGRVVTKLHALLKPFMLRRLKADVEISLPRKQELLLYAPMTDEQKRLNQQLLDKTLGAEMAKLAESEGVVSTSGVARLNNVLMQMRKNCNHPDLITSAFTSELDYPPPEVLEQQSGKLALLGRLLARLKAGGHKVLIFSQMTRMLDLLESYLGQKGHEACRLDGGVQFEERQRQIEAFNGDPTTWLFLLSTRAGGLGINLTAADTVIIYDSDWNPHQDLQAMDRCHRIGQDRPVLVLRLATSHSVEGKMLRRACDKMALERLVIKKGVFKEVLDEVAPGGGASSSSSSSKAGSVSAAELISLLRADVSLDDVPQSGVVSDEMLERLLDRSWMMLPAPAAAGDDNAAAAAAAEAPSTSGGGKKAGKGGRRASKGGAGEAAAAAAAAPQQPRQGGGVAVMPYPPTGVGYEAIAAVESTLLSNVNG